MAFDPVAAGNFKKKYPEGKIERGTISYVDTAQEALKHANICFVFTEWEQIRELTPSVFKENMKTPLVYDGRNVYDVLEMKDAGVEYYSIGR